MTLEIGQRTQELQPSYTSVPVARSGVRAGAGVYPYTFKPPAMEGSLPTGSLTKRATGRCWNRL